MCSSAIALGGLGFKCSLSRTVCSLGNPLMALGFLVEIQVAFVLGAVDTVESHCFRRSSAVSSSTGPVGERLWTTGAGENSEYTQAVPRFGALCPQVFHEVSPGYPRGRRSCCPCGKLSSTGRPQVIHESSPGCPQVLPRVVHMLRTASDQPVSGMIMVGCPGASRTPANRVIHKRFPRACASLRRTTGHHPLRACCLIRLVSSVTWL